jgi:hypothetical protein
MNKEQYPFPLIKPEFQHLPEQIAQKIAQAWIDLMEENPELPADINQASFVWMAGTQQGTINPFIPEEYHLNTKGA